MHGSERLGNDRKIDAADAALEHCGAEDEGEQRRHRQDGKQREGQRLERHPEERQFGDLIPVHEVRDAGRRLDLGILDARGFQLEERRHAVATEAEEHVFCPRLRMPVWPQHSTRPTRDERVGEILSDQVETEDIRRKAAIRPGSAERSSAMPTSS